MHHIIAALDNSEQQHHVIHASIWAAKRRNEGICFVHALEKGAHNTDTEEQNSHIHSRMNYESGLMLLKEAAQTALDAGVCDVDMQQHHDELMPMLLKYCKDASLLVMGRHDKTNRDKEIISSHIEFVTRRVAHPILLTTGPFTPPESVMIAYDGRETALNLIKKINQGSLLHGLNIHIVMIGENTTANHELLDKATALLNTTGSHICTALIQKNQPPMALNEYIAEHNIDMLVMGAFAHSSVRRLFLGSKTLNMIASSRVPLLIMR